MYDKLKLFFTNWKTAVPGLLAAVCASDSLFFGFLPEAWHAKGTALCVFLVAMGLIAAKDADKSNASNPEHTAVTVK